MDYATFSVVAFVSRTRYTVFCWTNVFYLSFFIPFIAGSVIDRFNPKFILVVGSALGTLPFGLSYDMTGRYDFVFNTMAIVTLLSVVMSLFIVKLQKKIIT